jgi:hypothetical protein
MEDLKLAIDYLIFARFLLEFLFNYFDFFCVFFPLAVNFFDLFKELILQAFNHLGHFF